MKAIMFVLFMSFASLLNAETVYLTSLSWPPYSGEHLDEQGASVAVAKAAFEAEGHELVVEFFPWSRAVKMTSQTDAKFVGYFPEYYFETSDFVFSNAMGAGPLGLVQNKDKPIIFDSVSDLTGKRIGVVQGYVNTKEIDDMIKSHLIRAEIVQSDIVNVRKVGAGRIDAAVIDANVLSYLLAEDSSLSSIKNKVEMNNTLLQNKALYIAFKNDAQGRKWQKIYNQGLRKIEVNSIMARSLY